MNTPLEITEHTCATHGCGIVFYISKGFEDRRRADKANFYCPNGHSLVYGGDTEVQALKRRLESKDSYIIALEADVRRLKRKPRKPREKKK